MRNRLVAGLPAICLVAVMAHAQNADLSGKWQVTIMQYGRPEYARVTLKADAAHWTGEMFGSTFSVSLNGSAIEVRCREKKGKDCGAFTGRLSEGVMSASGKLFDEEAAWTARRAPVLEGPATRHEFVPKVYHNHFSGLIEPALHINPGDTVHTTTVDAGGVDANGVHVAAGGNPLTGPFYVEGAWPGDTLVVKLKRVRLNRDTAGTYSNSVVLSALDPYYARDQKKVENFDSTWKLDRQLGIAVLTKPTDRLKNFQVKLAPMMGCIGVAPPSSQAFRSGYLGDYGGNMDYNQLREGTTLYLPVFQPGALLFVGDGHAAQGDGELTGNALETSMEVEFTVNLDEGWGLHQPYAENDEYIMVLGIDNSLEEALRSATTGMSRWLAHTYNLNGAEIAMVLGSSMHYDIAEVVDPYVHVVAKVSKSVLKTIEPSISTPTPSR
jgi:acetamidase/formamidase